MKILTMLLLTAWLLIVWEGSFIGVEPWRIITATIAVVGIAIVSNMPDSGQKGDK